MKDSHAAASSLLELSFSSPAVKPVPAASPAASLRSVPTGKLAASPAASPPSMPTGKPAASPAASPPSVPAQQPAASLVRVPAAAPAEQEQPRAPAAEQHKVWKFGAVEVKIGDLVEANWRGKGAYHPALLRCVNVDGTCNVQYVDDGSVEESMHRVHIRAMASRRNRTAPVRKRRVTFAENTIIQWVGSSKSFAENTKKESKHIVMMSAGQKKRVAQRQKHRLEPIQRQERAMQRAEKRKLAQRTEKSAESKRKREEIKEEKRKKAREAAAKKRRKRAAEEGEKRREEKRKRKKEKADKAAANEKRKRASKDLRPVCAAQAPRVLPDRGQVLSPGALHAAVLTSE